MTHTAKFIAATAAENQSAGINGSTLKVVATPERQSPIAFSSFADFEGALDGYISNFFFSTRQTLNADAVKERILERMRDIYGDRPRTTAVSENDLIAMRASLKGSFRAEAMADISASDASQLAQYLSIVAPRDYARRGSQHSLTQVVPR